MTPTKSINNVKLGLFVIAGALFLVFSLYMLGRNQSLFGPTFTVTANFTNINGLVPGNNVRFSGIDVGTVKEVRIESDTVVTVIMALDKKVQGFIKQNAQASIGSDGLMGNKLVNINPVPGKAEPLANHSILASQKPVETDEMLRTLKITNDNMAVITNNLKEMSTRLNRNNSLWSVLGDTTMAYDLKRAASDLHRTGTNTAALTRNANQMILDLKNGSGIAQSLFTDTTLRRDLQLSVVNIQEASKKLSSASAGFEAASQTIRTGHGPVGTLLFDTVSSQKIKQSFTNIEQGTAKFNENMEALRHHFLFRGYFKKLEKEEAKNEKK